MFIFAGGLWDGFQLSPGGRYAFGDDGIGSAIALDTQTGQERWVSGGVTGDPAVTGDLVLVPNGSNVYGYDIRTGVTLLDTGVVSTNTVYTRPGVEALEHVVKRAAVPLWMPHGLAGWLISGFGCAGADVDVRECRGAVPGRAVSARHQPERLSDH